jgi:parallel beta-helix repeat protein
MRTAARTRRPMRARRTGRRARIVISLLLLMAAAVSLFALATSKVAVPPRLLGPYLEHRLSGHHPLLDNAGRWMAETLITIDRGEIRSIQRSSLIVGAQAQPTALPGPGPGGARVRVRSPQEARHAIRHARPGDVITFEPGTYRFDGSYIDVNQTGAPAARITVRAERPGTVTLDFAMSEGFVVSAPHWSFENLTIRGVCAQHADCEHAFHVVGAATHFAVRNNILVDFNAHIKVNGQERRFPDHGLIEGNTLTNSSARRTASPVTPIDLVGVSHWVIRGNLITDFVKAHGDLVSYGAFAKGGGSDNRFERNVVWCELLLRGVPGWRVGLSLGGGGSDHAYCRDRQCITEQDGSMIDSNLVASCSDDGIYINRAATTRVTHNTLLDTGGISVRFVESSADVEGNLVDGTIRVRDGALLRASDNLRTNSMQLYLGLHPLRSLYRDATAFDLAWSESSPRRKSAAPSPIDLCGATRRSPPAYGAFEDFSICVRPFATMLRPP